MKKFFYSAVAALTLIGAASCDNAKSGAADDQVLSSQASDSLMITFGEFAGNVINSQISGAMQQDEAVSKKDFVRGLQSVFASDTAQAYLNGINFGLQIQNELARFEKMGVKVDRNLWLNKFKAAFMQDSVPTQQQIMALQQEFQIWNDSLRNAKHAYDLRQIENSEESQANLQASKAYVDSIKAADPQLKETPSGLVYKIENPGEGDRLKPSDRVVLNMQSKALKGANPPSVPNSPIAFTAIPKGIQEGLLLLGKGGKAIFYVPGKSVYELDMASRMGLAPNSLLIYEVEVQDVQ